MEGSLGLEKRCSSLCTRPPPLSVRLPLRFSVQPPFHVSWSSWRRGYPCPGRVSTLLNQTYSVPARLVHACLQVTEQVWQPMHLSRFITIAIWAMTRIRNLSSGERRWVTSVDDRRRALADHRDLVPVVPGGPDVVEEVGELR